MSADRMTTKGYVGVTLFIILLFCIIHVYHRTDPESQSHLSERRFTFPPQKGHFLVKESSESSPNSRKSIQLSASFGEHYLNGPGRPTRQWKNSSYEVDLLKRIAGSNLPDDEFLQLHLERQQERHAQRDAVCSSMYGTPYGSPPDNRMAHNIWVNEKYKFVYCSIPKVACTSWKSVLLVLDDIANSTYQFSQETINRRSGRWMKQLWNYSQGEQKDILRTYTKFMFSRDPFTRVLSAFRNKLAPDSFFVRAPKLQAMLGAKILQSYRVPGWHRGDPYDLKFSEFSRYVSSGHGFNKHWNKQYLQCMPCDIDYTILGHFETIHEDADFILKVVGADNAVSFPASNHSSPTNSSDESIFISYYNSLSDKELLDLYKIYGKDFDLFGYPPPKRLENLD